MAALSLSSPLFLSSGVESLRSSDFLSKKLPKKDSPVTSASCNPTWQRAVRSSQYARARRAAAMAANWQAGCQPGANRYGDNAWWMGGVPRGNMWKQNWSLQEVFGQLAGLRGCQLEETNDAWILKIALPGLSANDVKVQVENDRVLLISQRDSTSRVILPENCQVADIKAQLKYGLLTVTLPRKKPVRSVRDVPVNAVAGQDADVGTSTDVAVENGDVAEEKLDEPKAKEDEDDTTKF